MQLKGIEKKEKNQVELTIEVGKEEFEKAMEQAYRKMWAACTSPASARARLPGRSSRSCMAKAFSLRTL